MQSIEDLKIVLRENDIPFFTDQELAFYLKENDGDYRRTAYQCLCVKAENTTLNISGLTTADTSAYFRRLASRYRPNNSGILKG
nr:MAG TPA: hypothetical protein [Caudoviricetes sp.]